MITLYKYIPAWGRPDIIPFCLKTETYLRIAGWQYQGKVGDSRKAPKQKLQDFLKSRTNLTSYCERMKARYWAE